MSSFEDIIADFEEKNIDNYVQVKKCPECDSDNLSFCWIVKSLENVNHKEIVKECLYCGEIFHAVYDENKKLLETRHGGHSEPERKQWIRKQKLVKLLEK